MTKDRAVIFDMDGLMIDSERVTYDGYVIECGKLGRTMDKEFYKKLLGCPVPAIHQMFREKFGQEGGENRSRRRHRSGRRSRSSGGGVQLLSQSTSQKTSCSRAAATSPGSSRPMGAVRWKIWVTPTAPASMQAAACS